MHYLTIRWVAESPFLDKSVGIRISQELTNPVFQFQNIAVTMSHLIGGIAALLTEINDTKFSDGQ